MPDKAITADVDEGLEGRDFSLFDETDWHVLAQDISHRWHNPDHALVGYRAAEAAIKVLRAGMTTALDRAERAEAERDALLKLLREPSTPPKDGE